MTDIHQPMPIRTLNAGDAAVKIVDGTTPAQALSVDSGGRVTTKLNDGAGVALTSTLVGAKQSLDVNLASSVTTPVDRATFTYGTSTYTPIGGVFQDTSPALTAGQGGAVRLTANRASHANLRDSSGNELLGSKVSSASVPVVIASDQGAVSVKDGADGPVAPGAAAANSLLIGATFNTVPPTLTTGQQAAVQVDSLGRLLIGSIASALPAGTASIGKVAQDNTVQWSTSDLADGPVVPGTVATKSALIGAQFNTSLPVLTTGQQAAVQVDSSGRLLIGSIAGSLPAGTNNIGKVSVQDSSGNPFTTANPLPVVVSQNLPGTIVNKYNTSVSLAVNGTTNHDYTITATKTFSLKKIWASATGRIRIDVILSPDGATFTNVVWTGFNTEANLNVPIDLDLQSANDVGTGALVRVKITNEDSAGSVFDVFSTISGVEN